MASPVQAQIILCDSAVSEPGTGKVHMLGAGWSITSVPTSPQAVVVLIKIPWDRTNQKIPVRLQLLTADGQPVNIPTPQGEFPISNEGSVEVGRPPGIEPGSLLDASFVLNVGPLPLAPGRYEWRLDLAEQEITASFQVQAPQVPPPSVP